jgi:small subunit ribosomal protein S1
MANETIEKPTSAEDGVWVTGPDGELIPDYESTFPTINEGEVVHGTVVRVDKDEVLVDIGYKSEGVIPVAELSIRRSVNPADEVTLGEEVDALVLTKEDAEGRLILSKKRARFELAWKKIEAAAESGEPVVGKVIEVVKGGLILDLGVRGFLPASLVDIRRVQDLDEFMGTELRCKVIELNRSRNNVVLSRRAVLEDERKEQRQQILDRLNPGDVVDGTISNIVDFGAFVDLDGMDGLIPELSWSHVNHPSEVLEIGQEVKVKVLDIDRERQRISLGLKQTQSDPWQQVIESYNEGDVVEGRVTKVVTFGAFVEILPGVEGLVHISELAQHHVENPREVVSQGDAVNVLILEVDADRRRLSLSLKRVEEGQQPLPRADGAESVHLTPSLELSEDVFPAGASSPSRWRRRRPPSRSRRSSSRARTRRRRRRTPRRRPSSRASRRPTAMPRRATSPTPPTPRKLSRPIAVAITGGIGAGKSEALYAFQKAGAATVSSDEIVHHLLRADPEVKEAIVRELGEDVLDEEGNVDRKRVAKVVFGDRAKLDFLERLLHPRVVREYLEWREGLAKLPNPPRVCVTEVPLLFETGGEKRFDKVVVITAPARLREQRRRVPRDDRDERLLPDREKVKRADFHYVNTGTLEELDAWVAGVMEELTA